MAQPQNADVSAVARSYFDLLINRHDVGFADTLFDPAVSFHDPAIPGGQVNGLVEVKTFFTTFFRAFPDVNFEINDFFVVGDRVAIRFTWTGTHRAKLFGIQVAERHVTVPGIDIFHIANGRIVS